MEIWNVTMVRHSNNNNNKYNSSLYSKGFVDELNANIFKTLTNQFTIIKNYQRHANQMQWNSCRRPYTQI